MVRVALRGRFRGVQEPLVAHVAFTAAEENIGTLLPLHTLVTAEDTEVEIRNTQSSPCTAKGHGSYFEHALTPGDVTQKKEKKKTHTTNKHRFPFPRCCNRGHETKHL